MTTATDPMNRDDTHSATKFQLRADLQWSEYAIGLENQVVIKDPLCLEYFQFASLERELLMLLQNPQTIRGLKSEADRLLHPAQVTQNEVTRFVRRLVNDGLLLTNQFGIGRAIQSINHRHQRQKIANSLLGFLAIRFPGINPRSLVDAANPFTKYLFRPAFVLVAAFGFVLAFVALLANSHRIFESEYLRDHWNDPRLLFPIALAVMVAKLLHELGHALACRSIGRDCHELGVMLLAFVPCLYCNVSDIWMEPNRWKRILVSAAGIYVEMFIAAICVPLWLASHPGLLQIFFISLATICSINTVFVNGNPLLRYDGYYVLSDLLQIPNLANKSRERISERFNQFFFQSGAKLQPLNFLDLYFVLSFVYRNLVFALIMLGAYTLLANLNLPKLGLLAATIIGLATFGMQLFRTVWSLQNMSKSDSVNLPRALTTCMLLIVLCAAILVLPVNETTYATGQVGIEEHGMLFASESGRIEWLVESGQSVEQGEAVAKIHSNDLDLQIQQQRQRIRKLNLKLEHLDTLQSFGGVPSGTIEWHKQLLANETTILNQLLRREQQLMITASVAGRVSPLPENSNAETSPMAINRASSTLLAINEACFVTQGEPIAVISRKEDLIAEVAVAETEISRVRVADQARLNISQAAPKLFSGTVVKIGVEPQQNRADDRLVRTSDSFFRIQIQIDDPADDMLLGSPVAAVITGRSKPFGMHIWQALRDNFNF